MTKINSAALANLHVRNLCYFSKPEPAEAHLLAQAFDVNDANPIIYHSTAAVPATGAFAPLYTENTAAGPAIFTLSNNGEVVVCDGKETLVWGGNEFRCAAFYALQFDAFGTSIYDYSQEVLNTANDAKNVAAMSAIAGGADGDCLLLMHLDNDVTDSSPTTPHTVANANMTFSTDAIFGGFSGSFNGTTAQLSIPDNADFSFAGGVFTVDLWLKTASLASTQIIYHQQTDASNYFQIGITTDGAVSLTIVAAAATVVSMITANGVISANVWYHVAVVEDSSNWYLFIDGIMKKHVSDTDRAANYTGTVYIGSAGTGFYFVGLMDEIRVSDVARWTQEFDPHPFAYGTSTWSCALIGTVRPTKGMKLYIGTANTAAGTMLMEYWNGNKWVAVASLTDGTGVAGKSLAQTGSVTYTDTKPLASMRFTNRLGLYWHRMSISAISPGTAIYYVVVDSSFQTIKDVWDGILLPTYGFFTWDTSAYYDQTSNVFEEDFSSANTYTYASLNALATTHAAFIGFTQRVTAIEFTLGAAVNTTPDCYVTLSYWNGAAWVSVGKVYDETLNGTSSMNMSGRMSWNAPAEENEFPKIESGELSLYIYRHQWSQPLSATVSVDYVGGIAAQKIMPTFSFAVFGQNRLMLGGNVESRRNGILISAANSSNIFNGDDSTELFFGDDSSLTMGLNMYVQFGSSLYDLNVFFKDNQTWILSGTGPSNWIKYQISDVIGCPAPLTAKIVTLGYDFSSSQNRTVAIWQGSEGIYLFDGHTLKAIHEDIRNWFDKRSSNSINRDKIGDSIGFVDTFNQEYHWCFASGVSTTLNKEFVYDLRRDKWYETTRAPALQAGGEVFSAAGNRYVYAGTAVGYIERLENGNDFDGNPITQTAQFGDASLKDTGFEETTIRGIKLMQVAKNTTVNNVAVTHYGDSSTTGTALSISPAAANKRLAINQTLGTNLGPHLLHALRFQLTTADETVGFEPLYAGVIFKDVRFQRG